MYRITHEIVKGITVAFGAPAAQRQERDGPARAVATLVVVFALGLQQERMVVMMMMVIMMTDDVMGRLVQVVVIRIRTVVVVVVVVGDGR